MNVASGCPMFVQCLVLTILHNYVNDDITFIKCGLDNIAYSQTIKYISRFYS